MDVPFYEQFDGRFNFPFSCILAGPSLSGKSSWIINFLDNLENIVSETIETVVWFYGVHTPTLAHLEEKYSRDWFTSVQGLPDINHLEQYIQPNKKALFVLDDLAQEAGNNVLITNLLNNYVHHKSISVFLVLQDLFGPGRYRASFLKSVHYLVLFKNPLNNTTGRIIAQRFLPGNVKGFQEIYDAVFSQPYNHMVLDGHQLTPDILRIRSDIFGLGQTIFIPKKK